MRATVALLSALLVLLSATHLPHLPAGVAHQGSGHSWPMPVDAALHPASPNMAPPVATMAADGGTCSVEAIVPLCHTCLLALTELLVALVGALVVQSTALPVRVLATLRGQPPPLGGPRRQATLQVFRN